MTPDLDLVKERCAIRNYPFREGAYRGRPWLDIGNTVRVWVNEDNSLSSTHTKVGWVEDLLRPRLTIADIIANPGEGWTATSECEGHGALFHRRNASGHILALIGWLGGKVTNDWCATAHSYRQPMKIAERIAAHRAVTDLLIKLAEIKWPPK